MITSEAREPSAFPREGVPAVGSWVAYGVVGYGLAVIGGQEVFPARRVIGVIYRRGRRAERGRCRVGVGLFIEYISARVVGVGYGDVSLLIVFADELTEVVVKVSRRVGAVGY